MSPQDTSPRIAACAVLDTNAVLDWQLFQEPSMRPLADALLQGQVRWIATPWMLNELRYMLCHDWPARWNEKSKCLLSSPFWDQVTLVPEPAGLPLRRPVCSDPDDQAFLDLALNWPARWLVTRDKALLKTARVAASRGVLVVRPEDWML